MSGTINKVYGQVYNNQGQYVKLDVGIDTNLLNSNINTILSGATTWRWVSRNEKDVSD